MRRFVIVGHKAHSTADFKLDDLAGGAGRLDVLLRCVNSTFFLSHNIRTDAEAYLVLLGPEAAPRTVRFLGNEIKYLNPDERSTGALVRNALLKAGKGLIKSSPGVYVSDQSFHDVMQELAPLGQIVYLRENGVALKDIALSENVTFVLSDHKDLTPEEEKELEMLTQDVVSLGPTSYHADHCITIVNHELDLRRPL